MSIKLVGILNVTPDSFSDGGECVSTESAIARARYLRNSGADIVDIGGQSTRPGSSAIGVEEEMQRLHSILPALAKEMPLSVDTYRPEVADWAIKSGAQIINDITAGSDPEMFNVVAGRPVKIVLMYSSARQPHDFTHLQNGRLTSASVIKEILGFFNRKIETAEKMGVLREQIILDPGMGAFLSSDPEISWTVVRHFVELKELSLPLMFASSRKGFLRSEGESSPKDRDAASALTGVLVARQFSFLGPDYIRTHNPGLQRQFLEFAKSSTNE